MLRTLYHHGLRKYGIKQDYIKDYIAKHICKQSSKKVKISLIKVLTSKRSTDRLVVRSNERSGPPLWIPVMVLKSILSHFQGNI